MHQRILEIAAKRVTLILAAAMLAGCAAYAVYDDAPPPERGPADIPPGHMPPPGKCRIWYPGEPPGQQPPPGDCRKLQYEVPPGAILVEG